MVLDIVEFSGRVPAGRGVLAVPPFTTDVALKISNSKNGDAGTIQSGNVSVTYVNYPGMVHGFFSFRGLVPKAREAVAATVASGLDFFFGLRRRMQVAQQARAAAQGAGDPAP